jgi:hypothetical protein
LILAKFPPAGMGRFNQFGRWLVPGIDVGSVEEVIKSERAGPEFRVSVKVVGGLRVPCGEMVARLRIARFEDIEVFEGRRKSEVVRLRRQ